MIARSMTVAAQLTRTWVAMYTAGLPEELACTRRDEIESDLWEQEAVGGLSNGEALARLVLGMPADVTWRLEQRSSQTENIRKKGKRGIVSTTTQWAFVGGACLMAAFTVFVTSLVAFGFGESYFAGVDIPRPLWMVWGVAAGGLILAGVRVLSTSPVRGGGLVLLGALPMSTLLYWSVLVPAVWLTLALLWIARAIAMARQNDHPAPA